MGYFSDILERQTSPWRLLLGKGTDRDKEILEEEKTKGLEALLTATKPFRMGANVLAQGYGPALRALIGRDPSTPGGLESLIREGVSTEEQDYLERKPYTAALKSGAGMTASLMPFATGGLGTLNYVANPLINKSLQYGLSGGVPGALGGFSYSGEGNELRDTLLGGGVGATTSLLGGYVFDPSYRELVNEAYRGAVPAGSQYEAALNVDVPSKKEDLTLDQTLLQEAKKYKSVDEFVESQGKTYYHQSQSKVPFTDFKQKGDPGYKRASYSQAGEGIYFSPDKDLVVSKYGKDKGTLVEGVISSKKKLDLGTYDAMYFDGRKVNSGDIIVENFRRNLQGLPELPEPDILLSEISEKAKDWLQARGYDAIEGMKGEMWSAPEIVVLDKNIIKTKPQLIDIWKKAWGK